MVFTDFYGNPKAELRRESWLLLNRIGEGRVGPCLYGGEFNEGLALLKIERANLLLGKMRASKKAMEIVGLVYLGLVGGAFTWRNLREGEELQG